MLTSTTIKKFMALAFIIMMLWIADSHTQPIAFVGLQKRTGRRLTPESTWFYQNVQPNQAKRNMWNDEHLAHGIQEIQEETDSQLKDSEDAAAWDAHDCNDAGMEAAAEERAVMLAAEMIHRRKEQQNNDQKKKNKGHLETKKSWNDDHLAHGIDQIHEETNAEIKDSEDAAAWDAHDCADPGMEAAAEERAVMLAAEMIHKFKERKNAHQKSSKSNNWAQEHLAHGIAEVHEETDVELKDSEDEALWDAYDCSDTGMEAAAEERAIMMAAEITHQMKQKAAQKQRRKS